MIRRLLGACIGVVVVTAWACGGSDNPVPTPQPGDDIDERPGADAGPDAGGDAGTDAGTDAGSDAGTDGGTDAGTDAGTDGGTDAGTDAGTDGGTDAGTDGGTDGGTDPGPTTGPWPTDSVVDYTKTYGLSKVKAVGVDAAHNIWLLNGATIGVLRADTKRVTWTTAPIGQASAGYSSTVICGGSQGRAYVGYYADDLRQDPEFPLLHTNYIISKGDPCYYPYQGAPECYEYSHRRLQIYRDGDVDVVRLDTGGQIVLEEHLHQSIRNTKDEQGNTRVQTGPRKIDDLDNLGIRNSNDHHYDEDRAIYSCVTVMQGANQGDVYVGSNHGVTRIRGLEYNAHRHPVWLKDGSQMAGYTYGLGIAQDGDVLIGNEWMFGIVTPTPGIGDWDNTNKSVNKMKVESAYLPALNSLSEFDSWRGFQQTTDGTYYLGSKQYGLWKLTVGRAADQAQEGTPVKGASAEQADAIQNINALAATSDGSLFIGTAKAGLWRLTPQKTLEKVAGVKGSEVLQLVYDPRVKPAMLYVLTTDGLTVLRDY